MNKFTKPLRFKVTTLMYFVDGFLLFPIVLTSEIQILQCHRMTKFSHLGLVFNMYNNWYGISINPIKTPSHTGHPGWSQHCPLFETLVPLENHHFVFTQQVSICITSLSSVYKKLQEKSQRNSSAFSTAVNTRGIHAAFLYTPLRPVDIF